MTLTPPTNIAPATVAVAGTVDVSDRAARLLGHVSVDNFPADQLVHFSTPVAVTGPLTLAELLTAGLATEATLSTLATAAGQAALTAALAGLSTEETLAAVNEAIQDVALTAILEREKVEP